MTGGSMDFAGLIAVSAVLGVVPFVLGFTAARAMPRMRLVGWLLLAVGAAYSFAFMGVTLPAWAVGLLIGHILARPRSTR